MQSSIDGLLGGYRMVRRLGVGTRSDVWLARSSHDGPEPKAVALKVFRREATTESIDRELAVLEELEHPHVVQLRDVFSGPSGLPALVFEQLGHESLAGLLADRSELLAGEVVTILAPIVEAVSALHSSGIAHGSLSAARVLFRSSGAPVLCGFGHIERLSGTSAVALAASDHVARDRSALARLASGLLGRVEGDGARQFAAWLQHRAMESTYENGPEELLARLFDLADAVPVRFDRASPDEPETVIPLRVHRAEPVAPEPESTPETATWIPVAVIQKARELAGAWRVPSVLRKRPVLLAIGIAIVLTIVVLAVPTGGAEPVTPSPSPSPSTTARLNAVGDDDPIAALAALMEIRATCVRDLSILCLDGVDQPGSSALDDDVALIRGIEAGEISGELAGVDPTSIVLTERLGDAALLEFERGPNSKPASTLLVKGEAGWRIRDYLEG